jgi:hypothetical protein
MTISATQTQRETNQMTNVIDKIQAVTPATSATFRQMPTNLGPGAVVATLQALGLNVPSQLAAVAAKGEALRAAAHRYPLKEVDAALAKADVPLADRFRFKTALDRNGLLGS